MVEVQALAGLPEVLCFTPQKFADSRGHFMETFRQSWLTDAGVAAVFVQDNQSFSAAKGTLRGLHFQRPPQAQGKLVRCLQGRIWDVAVDIRPSSATLGTWVAQELTAERGEQLYIPPGFAHGFLTLVDNCIVAYKCTAYYSPQADGAIHFADPQLAIDWPTAVGTPILSEKDAAAPNFGDYFADCLESRP